MHEIPESYWRARYAQARPLDPGGTANYEDWKAKSYALFLQSNFGPLGQPPRWTRYDAPTLPPAPPPPPPPKPVPIPPAEAKPPAAPTQEPPPPAAPQPPPPIKPKIPKEEKVEPQPPPISTPFLYPLTQVLDLTYDTEFAGNEKPPERRAWKYDQAQRLKTFAAWPAMNRAAAWTDFRNANTLSPSSQSDLNLFLLAMISYLFGGRYEREARNIRPPGI